MRAGNLHYYKTLIYDEVTCVFDYVTAYMFQMAHLDFFLRHLQTKRIPPKSPRVTSQVNAVAASQPHCQRSRMYLFRFLLLPTHLLFVGEYILHIVTI